MRFIAKNQQLEDLCSPCGKADQENRFTVRQNWALAGQVHRQGELHAHPPDEFGQHWVFRFQMTPVLPEVVEGHLVLTHAISIPVAFGFDTLTGVNDADYQPPLTFNGKINKITLAIDRPKLTSADETLERYGGPAD